MKHFTYLFLATSVMASAPSKITQCTSAKEYITSYQFLKDKKDFALKNSDILKIAGSISKGCSEAAQRFINVTTLLSKAGLETSDAINTGIKFSMKSDKHAQAFITIFKESFLKKYLDLNLKRSVELATSLSESNAGDVDNTKSDFQDIVKFCLSKNDLDLSGPKCADLALKIAKAGIKYDAKVSDEFISLYRFLTSKKHGNISTYKAINTAVTVIEFGPLAGENFKQAFKFADGKDGLNKTKKEAIDFAMTMASRTIKE